MAELERLVAEHPLRERFHAHRIVALYRAGRQADALEAYRRARTVLRENWHRPRACAPAAGCARCWSRTPCFFRSSPRFGPSPHCRRPRTPSSVDRAELGDIVSLLKDESVRVVTLIGPGGTGKTRLALEWRRPCNRTVHRASSLWPRAVRIPLWCCPPSRPPQCQGSGWTTPVELIHDRPSTVSAPWWSSKTLSTSYQPRSFSVTSWRTPGT